MSDQEKMNSRPMNVTYKEPKLPSSSIIVWLIGVGIVVLLVWAWLFSLEEVSTGTGKVVPSSKNKQFSHLKAGF